MKALIALVALTLSSVTLANPYDYKATQAAIKFACDGR
jgi:hypothetical protein